MTEQEVRQLEESHPHGGHERVDAGPKIPLWSGVILTVLGVGTLLSMWGLWHLFHYWEPAARISPLSPPRELPPSPRLQPTPYLDWQAMKQTDLKVLNSYGWADRSANAVRIPIDRAIELTLQRGLPARNQPMKHFPEVKNDAKPQ